MEAIRNSLMEGKLTLEYASTGRSLAFYRAQEGPLLVIAELSKGIGSLASAYNIGKSLSNDQIVDIADAILADYPTLKLAEFMYFIQKAKKGGYGKAYDRMDMPTIFEWLDKFFQEKEELLEQKRYQEKTQYEITGERIGKESIRDVFQDPEYQKLKLAREIELQRNAQKTQEATD